MNSNTQNNAHKSFVKNRLIPAIILVLTAIPLFTLLLVSFNPTYNQNLSDGVKILLKSISSVFLIIFSFWLFFELNMSTVKNKPFAVLLSSVALIGVFGNIDLWKQLLLFIGKQTEFAWANNLDKVGILTRAFVFDWYLLLIPILAVIFRIMIKLFIIKMPNYKWLIIHSLIYGLTIAILIIFIKLFIVLLTQNYGLELIMLFLFISCGYDIGGYFGGKTLGHKFIKPKLAPKLSPKKTYEGAFVGYLTSMLVALILISSMYGIKNGINSNLYTQNTIFNYFLNTSNFTAYIITFLFIAPFAALFGDLYFSGIKRMNGIKDFSKLLKEHGGALDRFDSISFVFVLFAILAVLSSIN
ncbi:phosphatidate cytidylyltransferase [Mycoplasma nasistruthionis]|uniref:Phosphatidate cytidylyltransferase n=1 Tax=Mycoplasma nasistruthionis TaxID=353852 RepID=A0A4Y6I7M5_9MOLU|nr:phosphatidate cytidylyltransferase [Mycoplasma nasistruthionis]QDF65199.1 phosphatidate cytidylyltransferase [Mycoplasma nasistruthionis]